MSTGSGFFGQGAWGRKVFWSKIPVLQQDLDVDEYLELLLKTWGDESETFLQQIGELPLQREPYEVRAHEGTDEWFYFTEAFAYIDDDLGSVIRLVGEKDYTIMPNHDEDDIPTADAAVLAEWWAWWPYAPISKTARWWETSWDDATYTVARVRTRSFDWPETPYRAATSQANEVWLSGNDLHIGFDYFNDDISWRTDWTSIGTGDGSATPTVALPYLPARIQYNTTGSAPWLTADAMLRVRLDLTGGGADYDLYDVPDGTATETGNLYPESGTPGQIDTTTSHGTINYQTGELLIDLAAAGDTAVSGVSIDGKWYVRGYYLPFYPPRIIDRLSKDFGFDNDKNDPEAVQRSTIANITKYHGLKATQDSYRIRGEISLFDVYARSLWRMYDSALWGSLPASNKFIYHSEMYTDVEPRHIKFDDIAADQQFFDVNLVPPGTWVTILDNSMMYTDGSTDGYSTGLAYGLDVAQGYYGRVSPLSATFRDPAGIVSSTQLTNVEAAAFGVVAGYRVVVRDMRCQDRAFNFNAGSFGLTEYDKAEGVAPELADSVLWIDAVETAWTLISPIWAATTAYILTQYVYSTAGDAYECTTAGTSGGTEPVWNTTVGVTTNDGTAVWTRRLDAGSIAEEDVGEWTVIVGVGVDSSGNPLTSPNVGHANILAANTGTNTFTISGDQTALIAAADTVAVMRSTGNDTTYTVASVALNGSDTDVVVGAIASAVADGEMGWTDIAIRYYPNVSIGSCQYCKSYKQRIEIEPTAEAYTFYDTSAKLNLAIDRVKNKTAPPPNHGKGGLNPITTRVVDWAITKEWILDDVYGGSTVDLELPGEFLSDDVGAITAVDQVSDIFTVSGDVRLDIVAGDVITVRDSTGNDNSYSVDNVDINANGVDTDVSVTIAIVSAVADGTVHLLPFRVWLTVEQRGDMGAAQTQAMTVYDEVSGVAWTSTTGTGVSDATTWYSVVSDLDLTSAIGNNSPVTIEAIGGGAMAYGDVRFTFSVSKYRSL